MHGSLDAGADNRINFTFGDTPIFTNFDDCNYS